MTDSLLLPLYEHFQFESIDSHLLHKPVVALLKGERIDLGDLIENPSLWNTFLSDENVIQNWKTLLSLAFINHFSSEKVYLGLSRKLHSLLQHPWNQHSAYLRTIIALCHQLLQHPLPALDLDILEGGAIPIALKEYCPWTALPYQPTHTELSVFLMALAFLNKKSEALEMACEVARWNSFTLDAKGHPLPALFIQEHNNDPISQAIWNYLLYLGASHQNGQEGFENILRITRDYLLTLNPERVAFELSPLTLLIEKLFERELSVENPSQLLPESIYDSSTSLVGYRSSSFHAIATLHGGHTGLGCFKIDDVHLINYGPQYLPLDDCRGFGIEGNLFSEKGIRHSMIERGTEEFSLKGCVRLVDQPDSSQSDFGKFRGIWCEIEQKIKERSLTLKASFLGFTGWEDVAFSFYVNAKKCIVNGITINPCSFQHYEGSAKEILITGNESSLYFQSSFPEGHLQIIPLGSGKNFWGADFLIAYSLVESQKEYQWEIKPSKTVESNQ